jgi:hypothetical protein
METSTLLFIGGGVLLVVIIITAIVTFKIVMWLADIFTPRYYFPQVPVIFPDRSPHTNLPNEKRDRPSFFTYLLITTLIVSLIIFLPRNCDNQNFSKTDRMVQSSNDPKDSAETKKKKYHNTCPSQQNHDSRQEAYTYS